MERKRTVISLVIGILVLCSGMVGLVVKLSGDTRGPVGDGSTLTPRVGTCRNSSEPGTANGFPDTFGGRYAMCTGPHEVETYHVGRIEGSLSDSEAYRRIGEHCRAEADTFLGGPMLTGKVATTSYLEENAPHLAKRWFSCDIAEVGNASATTLVTRTGTLRGALVGTGPLVLGCANTTTDDLVFLVDCATPHTAELAGLYTLREEVVPADSDARDRAVAPGCQKTVTDFLGWDQPTFEDSDLLEATFWGPTAEKVRAGDRVFQCFVTTLDDRKLMGSVRALGPRKVPVVA